VDHLPSNVPLILLLATAGLIASLFLVIAGLQLIRRRREARKLEELSSAERKVKRNGKLGGISSNDESQETVVAL
jgi:hypothetical protein